MLFGKHKKLSYSLFFICFITIALLSSDGFGQILYESAPSPIAESDYTVVDKNGKLGLADKKGQIVVPANYKKIRINKDHSISGLPFTEWQVLDGENNPLAKLTYDTIVPIAPKLLKVSIGEQEALADSQGNLLTTMREWHIFPFEKSYALVSEGGTYGVLNAGGKITVPIQYDTLILGEDYLVGLLHKEGKNTTWQALQYSGEPLFKKTCNALLPGSMGYFPFLENGSWGFLDYQGNKAILNQYAQVDPFVNGRAIARYMDSDGVINRNGEWLIMPRKDHLEHLKDNLYLFQSQKESGILAVPNGEVYSTTHEFIPLNHGFLEKNKTGKVGLISPEGKRLLTTEYDEISPLQNDTVYYFRKDKHWGIITKSGIRKLGLNNPIQEMYPMGDQFIGVKIDNKYGFVDINGDLRIANRYEAIGTFSENMAAVKLVGKWGYVDRIERLFVQPLYEAAFPFQNDLAIVKRDGKYGLVNRSGELVQETAFDSIYSTKTGRYISVKRARQGLIGKDGHTLIYPKYDKLVDLDNGYVLIYRNKEFGLLTTNGISTIPLMYDQIIYNPFEKVYYAAKSPRWETLKVRLNE